MTDVRRAVGGQWQQRGDVLVAVFVCVAIMMLLVPLPAVLLDLFMLLNICLSLLVILIVLHARNTMEFTVFPTLLLLATVFGLALNVSSTRLILAQGAAFDGRIVRAFGSFVVGASGAAGYLVGLVIFTMIIAVQFVVITKGSTRVAEVAARFTLDALPGRQMAIDAEYHAGPCLRKCRLGSANRICNGRATSTAPWTVLPSSSRAASALPSSSPWSISPVV